jgi:LysM repeat protein
MWDSIILNAAAVSHTGRTGKENGGNFYLNGQYMVETDFGNVRTSFENSAGQFVFAVCQDLGNQPKEASAAMIKEIDRIHGENEDAIITVEERAKKMQECFDVTSNLLNIYETTKKPVFASMVFYKMKAAVYNAGKGSVIVCRNRQMSVPEQLVSFDVKIGDMFLMTDRVLMETLGEEAVEKAMNSSRTATEAINILFNEAIKSDYEDDINIIVVKAVKLQNEMPVGVMDDVEEDDIEDRAFSKKLVKSYDKKQETLRTIIVAILTVLVMLAVVFTIYKILTGDATETPSGTAVKTTPKTNASATATPVKTGATTAPTQTAAPTSAVTTIPPPSGEYTLYTVKSGDSLSAICGTFYKDESKYIAVAEYNNIPPPYNISIGQVLKMPTNP